MSCMRRWLSLSLLLGAALLAAAEPSRTPPDPPAADDAVLPPGALARFGSSWFQHGNTIFAVAFTPDGQTLAAGDGDRLIRLWDVATGKERRRLAGHENYVRCLAVSPDGKVLASGSGDQTIRL